ncbi:MAG: hypothetical protein P8Y94_18300 [Acidobacteriota bacterium]
MEVFAEPLPYREFRTTKLSNVPSIGFMTENGIYVWQDGCLGYPFPDAGPAPEFQGAWAEGFWPLEFDATGNLLVGASLCCYRFDSALYLTRPPRPVVSRLPLLAIGQKGELRYSSTLILANDSSDQGTTTVVGFAPPSIAVSLPAEVGSGSNTGVALTNDASSGLNLELELSDPATNIRRTSTLTLPPGSQQSVFVTELFDPFPGPFVGTLKIETHDQPFLVAGLRMTGSRLSTLPVEPRNSQARSWTLERMDSSTPVIGPGGRLARLADRTKIELIDGDFVSESVDLSPVLPETGYPGPDVEILGFQPGGSTTRGPC